MARKKTLPAAPPTETPFKDRPEIKALDAYCKSLNAQKHNLKVLEDHGMACTHCAAEHHCEYAHDPYNFNSEPLIDCLAAK